jgi:hypothetical protein
MDHYMKAETNKKGASKKFVIVTMGMQYTITRQASSLGQTAHFPQLFAINVLRMDVKAAE